MALRIAGLVWETGEEVCLDIGIVVEEDCRIGGWSLSRGVVVVDAEDLIAGVAVGMRGSELPVISQLGSALASRAGESKVDRPVLALHVYPKMF